MSNQSTLYVRNLPFDTTDEGFHNFFVTNFGDVESAKVAFREEEPTRSKGWGLVTFSTAEAASDAVEKINEMEYEGRQLSSRVDRGPTESRPVDTTAPVDASCLFVGNLPLEFSSEELAALFEGFTLESAKLQRRRRGGGGRDPSRTSSGVVKLDSAASAAAAADALNGTEVGGSEIVVREDRPKTKPASDNNNGGGGEAGTGVEGGGRKRRSRGGRGRGGGGGGGGEGEGASVAPVVVAEPAAPVEVTAAFVKNLPAHLDSDGLKAVFGAADPQEALVVVDADGASRGFGTVTFADAAACAAAIASMDGHVLAGGEGDEYVLEVREDLQQHRGAAGGRKRRSGRRRGGRGRGGGGEAAEANAEETA